MLLQASPLAPIMHFTHLPRHCPLARLFVRNSMKRQTAIKSPTKHPRWNETFEFPVHVAEHQELVSVLHLPGCTCQAFQVESAELVRCKAEWAGAVCVMFCAAAAQCRRMLCTAHVPTRAPHPAPTPQLQRMILYDYDWASANDEIGRGEGGAGQCEASCSETWRACAAWRLQQGWCCL